MDPEYEQLLKEHLERQKGKRYNSFGVINNLYRILRSMVESENKFFTISELGFYEGTRNQIHIHAKQYIIDKSIEANWIKQMSLPNDEKLKMQEENINGFGKKRGRPLKRRMTEAKYYTLTEEGYATYKNIKEILDKLAS
jgi:hypothetical protein